MEAAEDEKKLVNEENDTYVHFNVQEGVDILICRCTKDADVEVEIEDTTASNI